jgi:hypothetical protein
MYTGLNNLGLNSISQSFSLANLFTGDAAGLWYGTGLTEGYQDSAGTTALTAPGQGTADCPEGYITDKSGNGLHSLQATAAARPVLSARVNPVIQTEDFTQAAWVKTAAGGVTAPAANKLVASVSGAAVHLAYQTAHAAAIVGLTYTNTIEIKAGELGWAVAVVELNGVSYGKYINLATGAVGNTYGTAAPDSITVTDAGDGYWRVSASKAATTTAAVYSSVYLANANGGASFAGDGTSGIYVRRAQVDIGAATTYQSVTTASNYATSGFPLFRKFDGIDDGHATAAFAAGTLTSNMDCFMVVKRNAATGIVTGFRAAASANYFGAAASGGAGVAHANSGTPTLWVNGTQVPGGTGTTEDQLNTAMPVGQWLVVEAHNLDLSAYVSMGQGYYAAGYPGNANFGQSILCPAQTDAVHAKIRTYLGATVGLSI